jgi:hypothetical protein
LGKWENKRMKRQDDAWFGLAFVVSLVHDSVEADATLDFFFVPSHAVAFCFRDTFCFVTRFAFAHKSFHMGLI